MRSEFKLIELLKRQIPRGLQGPFEIGDDAAVLPHSGRDDGGGPLLLTTDTVVDGVDFRIGKISPEDAGRKALAVNLSDIAAMGGVPTAFVAALGIPRSLNEKWLLRFYWGMIRLAVKHRTLCVGGDISRSRSFFASISLLGRAVSRRIIGRSGARPGDWIAVTGRLGGSILAHHCRFTPRLAEGKFLAENYPPNAMMDLSDGLVQDLGHILQASGVSASIDLARIPISAAARKLAKGNSCKALEHALTDGEDFELLLTPSPQMKPSLDRHWRRRFPSVPLSWIGRIERGKGKISWLWNGKKIPPPRFRRAGFSHF